MRKFDFAYERGVFGSGPCNQYESLLQTPEFQIRFHNKDGSKFFFGEKMPNFWQFYNKFAEICEAAFFVFYWLTECVPGIQLPQFPRIFARVRVRPSHVLT
jgi:hypothetical protein